LCERCGQDVKLCVCEPVAEVPLDEDGDSSKHRLRIRVEKRKRGKQVTLITGFTGSVRQRQDLLTQLKNHLGAGGKLDEDRLEIQGSHSQRIEKFLRELGYRIDA